MFSFHHLVFGVSYHTVLMVQLWYIWYVCQYDWFIDVSESVYLEELFNLPDATVLWEEVELAVPVVHTALVDHTVELTDQGLLALQVTNTRLIEVAADFDQ